MRGKFAREYTNSVNRVVNELEFNGGGVTSVIHEVEFVRDIRLLYNGVREIRRLIDLSRGVNQTWKI